MAKVNGGITGAIKEVLNVEPREGIAAEKPRRVEASRRLRQTLRELNFLHVLSYLPKKISLTELVAGSLAFTNKTVVHKLPSYTMVQSENAE